MPRYFFNVVGSDSKNVAKDNEGVVLLGVREARKEAVGLAGDFVKTRVSRINPDVESGCH